MLEFLLTIWLMFVIFIVMFTAGCAVSVWLLILEQVAKLGNRFAEYLESKHKKGQ